MKLLTLGLINSNNAAKEDKQYYNVAYLYGNSELH